MALPKKTKTHRWDRQLIAQVEDLARRTGRPVQHVLDDAVTIGLEQIEDEIDNEMRELTAWEAWEGYIGSQSAEEFWQISQEQGTTTYAEAAEKYARDLPNMFRSEWIEMKAGKYPDLDRLAALFEECLEEALGPLEQEQ